MESENSGMKTGTSFEVNLSKTNEVAKESAYSAITKHTLVSGKMTSFMVMEHTFQKKAILLKVISVVQNRHPIK